MTRRAKRPLDEAALRKADDAYYSKHPEMVDKSGKRVPIPAASNDPCSRLMANEWLDLYVANGGREDKSAFPLNKVGNVVAACPDVKKVLTPKEAEAVFKTLKANENTPFDYPPDCCYSRAHVMCRTMKDQCIESQKVWYYAKDFGAVDSHGNPLYSPDLHPSRPDGTAVMFPDDTGLNRPVEWVYHVAPIVKVSQPVGPPQDMVLDPSLASGPITIEEWKKIQGKPAGAYQEISDKDSYFQNTEIGARELDPDLKETCAQIQKHQRDRDAKRRLGKTTA